MTAKNVTVENVMAPVTIVIGPKDTVGRVRRIMKAERIHALPVVDAYNAPLGVVTSTDLVPEIPARRRVSRIMSTSLVTIGRQASAAAAARLMRRHRIHHLLVIQAGRIVGIVSTFDLLRLVGRSTSPHRRASSRRK